jgi:hypothetical protein
VRWHPITVFQGVATLDTRSAVAGLVPNLSRLFDTSIDETSAVTMCAVLLPHFNTRMIALLLQYT